MRINDAFILRKIYGQFLLVPVRTNEAGEELISLNEVGACIWELAAQGLSEEEIITRINELYNLDEGSVEEKATASFIEILCKRSLLYREEV